MTICCLIAFPAMTALSIFIPPEVEPEHPQKNEQSMMMKMLSPGHKVVSAVANPVVELMEHTWKRAARKAFSKEL